MHVICNGDMFRIIQLGPDFLILEEADDFDGPAELVLSVDGEKYRRHVQVQSGATSSEKTVLFAAA